MSMSPSETGESGERIVVGVDASEESREALRWAARYARMSGGRLEVVHAWHIADEHAWLQTLPPPAGPTDVARQALRTMVETVVGDQVPFETAVVEGHAAKALLEVAKGAALLVMGSTGMGALDGLLGSVSQRCAARAPCPIVIVRPRRD